MARRRLRVGADYGAFPVWDLDVGGMVDASDLPIDAAMAARLQSWADRYDATLDMDDPVSSGFSSAEDEAAFDRAGEQLARELQRQLGPDFEVWFGDVRAAP